MKEFLFYSEKKIYNTIKEMFVNFESHLISTEKIINNNYINQNILLIVEEAFLEHFKESFFLIIML